MRPRVATVTQVMVRANRRSVSAAPGAGTEGVVSTTREMSRAKRVMATRRWATTDSAWSSRATTRAPSSAWENTTGTVAMARRRARGSIRRRAARATPARARVRKMTTEAVSRCEYSMMAWYSSGGTSDPWQRGQSGQPRPESVARTIPPTTTSR